MSTEHALPHDLVIVGAGPGGAAAALTARAAGLRVLIIDKAGFPRDKVCGDALSPDGVAALRRLEVADSVLEGRSPTGRVCLVSSLGQRAQTESEAAGYVVPREILDARLVEAALAAGAELLLGSVSDVVRGSGSVEVVLRDGQSVQGRCVIGADGAYSTVRRSLGLGGNGPTTTALAIRGYAPVVDDTLHIHWAAEHSPAYSWSFPAGVHPRLGEVANVGYGLSVADSRRLGGRAQMLAALTGMLPGAVEGLAEIRAHQLPLSVERPAPGHGCVLLVGDAASLIHPLTGEGIGYALASGIDAAEAVISALQAGEAAQAGERYTATLHRRLGAHLRSARLLHNVMGVSHLGPRALDASVRAIRSSPELLEPFLKVVSGEGAFGVSLGAGVARGYLRDRRQQVLCPGCALAA